MKFKLDHYEVEVKASSSIFEDDEEATKFFLNLLVPKLHDAGDYETEQDRMATAKQTYDLAHNIFRALEQEGFYGDK